MYKNPRESLDRPTVCVRVRFSGSALCARRPLLVGRPSADRWNPINSKDLQAELKLLDGSFPGIAPGVPSPSKHVPCSLHWREEQERKRLQLEAVGRPESPDLTDCAPRGPIVFRREDDE